MNHNNYENHKDEIEILKNILFDDLKIVEDTPIFKLELTLKADVIEPKILLKASIDMIESYPEKHPRIEIVDSSNYLPSKNIRGIASKISDFISENPGFPVIYQVYEMLKEFVIIEESELTVEHELKAKKQEEDLIDAKIKKENEISLLETKTFTPVNRETYEKWFKTFMDEVNKNKKNKKKTDEIASRQSGREFFVNMKNPKDIEAEDKLEQEYEDSQVKNDDVLFYDTQAFDEDIDNIDFDNIAVEDD